MNKNMLWIGVLILVVLGLIVVGRNMNPPQTEATQAETPAPEAAAPAQAPAAKSAPKAPPKATAAPKNGVAELNAMPESIMLDLSSEFAKSHQSDLEKFIKNDADFDRYYVVAEWGCGQNCTLAGVIDKRTGKAYIAPANNIRNKQPGSIYVPYTIDSNLYRVINDDLIETYSFDGRQFTLVNIENF